MKFLHTVDSTSFEGKPNVKVVVPIYAKWEPAPGHKVPTKHWICTNCRNDVDMRHYAIEGYWSYCPHCGAVMENVLEKDPIKYSVNLDCGKICKFLLYETVPGYILDKIKLAPFENTYEYIIEIFDNEGMDPITLSII